MVTKAQRQEIQSSRSQQVSEITITPALHQTELVANCDLIHYYQPFIPCNDIGLVYYFVYLNFLSLCFCYHSYISNFSLLSFFAIASAINVFLRVRMRTKSGLVNYFESACARVDFAKNGRLGQLFLARFTIASKY